MSLSGWYHQKAAQCARMAKESADPIKRANLLKDRKLWLELAGGIELHERGEFEGINGGRTKGPIKKNLH
jgi:hypothetical protein